MYNTYVREPHAKEMKAFVKVENAIANNWNEFTNLVFEEEVTNLLNNRIANPDLLAFIEKYGLTIEEVCIWYFMC